jgi:hypothetical protein
MMAGGPAGPPLAARRLGYEASQIRAQRVAAVPATDSDGHGGTRPGPTRRDLAPRLARHPPLCPSDPGANMNEQASREWTHDGVTWRVTIDTGVRAGYQRPGVPIAHGRPGVRFEGPDTRFVYVEYPPSDIHEIGETQLEEWLARATVEHRP